MLLKTNAQKNRLKVADSTWHYRFLGFPSPGGIYNFLIVAGHSGNFTVDHCNSQSKYLQWITSWWFFFFFDFSGEVGLKPFLP